MSGQLSFIPTSLPPGLYEQAAGTSIATHPTGGSSFSRVQQQYTGTSLQPQITGQKRAPPILPSRKAAAPAQVPVSTGSPFGGAASPFSNGQPAWDVTAAEKVNSDRFFDTLDTQKVNYIEGDVAVPFMLQSNLPEGILAQVWYAISINSCRRATDFVAQGSRRYQQRRQTHPRRLCRRHAPNPREARRQRNTNYFAAVAYPPFHAIEYHFCILGAAAGATPAPARTGRSLVGRHAARIGLPCSSR